MFIHYYTSPHHCWSLQVPPSAAFCLSIQKGPKKFTFLFRKPSSSSSWLIIVAAAVVVVVSQYHQTTGKERERERERERPTDPPFAPCCIIKSPLAVGSALCSALLLFSSDRQKKGRTHYTRCNSHWLVEEEGEEEGPLFDFFFFLYILFIVDRLSPGGRVPARLVAAVVVLVAVVCDIGSAYNVLTVYDAYIGENNTKSIPFFHSFPSPFFDVITSSSSSLRAYADAYVKGGRQQQIQSRCRCRCCRRRCVIDVSIECGGWRKEKRGDAENADNTIQCVSNDYVTHYNDTDLRLAAAAAVPTKRHCRCC